MSQLTLACEADVSSRHVSFLETGRSQPSRDMVLRLAQVLEVPNRQTNSLLMAAGFTATYTETNINDPALAQVLRSVEMLIERHNPFPTVVMDACWNVHLQNAASAKLTATLLDPTDLPLIMGGGPLNVVRALFHPQGYRPSIVNWTEVAAAVIQRLNREIAVRGVDHELPALLQDVVAMANIPNEWLEISTESEVPLIVPLHIRHGQLELKLFTAITTLGTALDVTLAELMMETFLPADSASETALRDLAES